MAVSKEQIVSQLENLLQKVRMQVTESSEIDYRIYEPQVHGQPYIIEVSKDRYVRRVPVDYRTAQNLRMNQPDPSVMRDVRTAILAVRRLADRRP